MFDKAMVRGLVAVAAIATAGSVRASSIPMATVPVGDAGNAADSTWYSRRIRRRGL